MVADRVESVLQKKSMLIYLLLARLLPARLLLARLLGRLLGRLLARILDRLLLAARRLAATKRLLALPVSPLLLDGAVPPDGASTHSKCYRECKTYDDEFGVLRVELCVLLSDDIGVGGGGQQER
jgi:hypothetical protein